MILKLYNRGLNKKDVIKFLWKYSIFNYHKSKCQKRRFGMIEFAPLILSFSDKLVLILSLID
jgi:hypothetical protein